jgi:hypothetical protein
MCEQQISSMFFLKTEGCNSCFGRGSLFTEYRREKQIGARARAQTHTRAHARSQFTKIIKATTFKPLKAQIAGADTLFLPFGLCINW